MPPPSCARRAGRRRCGSLRRCRRQNSARAARAGGRWSETAGGARPRLWPPQQPDPPQPPGPGAARRHIERREVGPGMSGLAPRARPGPGSGRPAASMGPGPGRNDGCGAQRVPGPGRLARLIRGGGRPGEAGAGRGGTSGRCRPALSQGPFHLALLPAPPPPGPSPYLSPQPPPKASPPAQMPPPGNGRRCRAASCRRRRPPSSASRSSGEGGGEGDDDDDLVWWGATRDVWRQDGGAERRGCGFGCGVGRPGGSGGGVRRGDRHWP